MKNTIKVTIPFSFKGIEHTPSSIIDLDIFIRGDQNLNSVFHLVANENKIDNYSYEYEVLQASSLHFSNATGLAEKHLTNRNFDFEGFKQILNEEQLLNTLQTIAKQTMNIENIEEHETLQLALEQAYQAGKNS
ncbi:MAG: hypothetical protein V3U71_13955 [Cocleimonas sp.]